MRKKRTTHAAAAVLAAVLAAVAVAGTAFAESSSRLPDVERLPVAIDTTNQAAWWRPLDVVDGDTYFAYDAPASPASQHEVHLAKRPAGSDEWTVGCLRTAAGQCAIYGDDVGHNQPSIVVDGEGHVHAFVSMHGHDWRYFRSTTPGDVTSLVEASSDMPDQGVGFTYPVTARGADGDAYLLVRAHTDDAGSRGGYLYRWSLDTHQWSRAAVVANATGHAVYPDDIEVDRYGRLHLLWEWGVFPSTAFRHLGSYLVYDPRTGTFSDVTGAAVQTPVTPNTPGAVIYQPFGPGETITSSSPALQSAKLALDHTRTRLAGVAYRYRTEGAGTFTNFDIRYATWDGVQWRQEIVAASTPDGIPVHTSAAIEATNAPGATRVYFVGEHVSACEGSWSQAVVAERPSAEEPWTFTTLGEVQPGLQRLRALESGPPAAASDTVYLAAPVADGDRGALFHAAVPRPIPGEGVPYADIARELGEVSGGATANLAFGADVEVSSTLRPEAGGEKAVDGICTDDSRWLSSQDDPAPTITIDLGTAADLSRIQVYSGYVTTNHDPTSTLKDFTVEVRTGAGWQQVAEVADNVDHKVVIGGLDVRGDAVRLSISDPSGNDIDVARVFEVELYGGAA